MCWYRTTCGLKDPGLLLNSRHSSNLPGRTRRGWWKTWNVHPDTRIEEMETQHMWIWSRPQNTKLFDQKRLHLALFSSPARSRIPQRVAIGGDPKGRPQPLALTWLRLSGCAALVPPRCTRYPVGVIQHPDDCPLTEATGLVLLLRRPKKGSGLSYESTSGQNCWPKPQIASCQSVHIGMRFASVKVSGVSYFHNYIYIRTKTVLSISVLLQSS